MRIRRRLLFALIVLTTGVAAWLFLVLWIAQLYEEPPNYSLIEDGLYMGGGVKRPPRGTQVVVNLCRNEDLYECDHQLWKPIRDSEPAPPIDWLREIVEYIDARREAGLTIYVHCRAGVSRSGMVVTAYLMFKNDWTRDEALEYIRTKRPSVRPNPAFMRRLLEWEEILRTERREARDQSRSMLYMKTSRSSCSST